MQARGAENNNQPVIDIQLRQANNREHFIELVEKVIHSDNLVDPQILDKALALTVKHYEDSVVHDPHLIVIAQDLITRGAKLEDSVLAGFSQKKDQVLNEMKGSFSPHHVSFEEGYPAMEIVLEKAESLAEPLVWSKPSRPSRTKETTKTLLADQDEEFTSGPSIPAEIEAGALVNILRATLRTTVGLENKSEDKNVHEEEIRRKESYFANLRLNPQTVKVAPKESSWGNMHQLLNGNKKKQTKKIIDERDQQFDAKHAQATGAIFRAKELLTKLENLSGNPEQALVEFKQYLAANKAGNKSEEFDNELLRRLNTNVQWHTAFNLGKNSGTRESTIAEISKYIKAKEDRVLAGKKQDVQYWKEKHAGELEGKQDTFGILQTALLDAKGNYEKAYRDFPWISYYFNHAFDGRSQALEFCSEFNKLMAEKNSNDRTYDVDFKSGKESEMINLLKNYLDHKSGLLSEHRDPLDENSFGTFLIKECYNSPLLRQYFGWNAYVPRMTHSLLSTIAGYLENYPKLSLLFNTVVGNYNGNSMVESRAGREQMREQMIEKLGQGLAKVPVANVAKPAA